MFTQMENPKLDSVALMKESSAIWGTLGQSGHLEPGLQYTGIFRYLHSDGVEAGGCWDVLESILGGSTYLWLNNWTVPPDAHSKIQAPLCITKSSLYCSCKVEVNPKASYCQQDLTWEWQMSETSQAGEYLETGDWRQVSTIGIILLATSSVTSSLLWMSCTGL